MGILGWTRKIKARDSQEHYHLKLLRRDMAGALCHQRTLWGCGGGTPRYFCPESLSSLGSPPVGIWHGREPSQAAGWRVEEPLDWWLRGPAATTQGCLIGDKIEAGIGKQCKRPVVWLGLGGGAEEWTDENSLCCYSGVSIPLDLNPKTQPGCNLTFQSLL